MPEGSQAYDDRLRVGKLDDHPGTLAYRVKRVPGKPNVPVNDQEAIVHGGRVASKHANLRLCRIGFEAVV